MNNDSEVAHPRSGSSFTRFLIELESVWKCWFLRREETVVPREKPLRAKERTNSLLIPRMAQAPGLEPRAALVGGEARRVISPLHYFPSHVNVFCISIFCFALVSWTRFYLKSMFCARCAAYMKTLASRQFLLSVVQEIIFKYVSQLFME